MTSSPFASIIEHFSDLDDPRAAHRIEYQLEDIVIITLCAVLCGADNWVEVSNYGRSKAQWLKQWLALPNGIPSHDTFEWVFARLKPHQLQQCFLNWTQAIYQLSAGELIAIDGKTLRGAIAPGERRSLIHMVSAWASHNRLVLGQRTVEEKSNEITAIPELLKILELEGALVSIDAMGCQTAIAETIIEGQGDYVLALKGNQGDLYNDVVQLFEYACQTQFRGIEHDSYQTVEKGHGRIEHRTYWTMGQTDYLLGAERWAQLKSIGCVESCRRQPGQPGTLQRRYYLLSIESNAQRFADAVRSHWGIENQLHWILDVGFREDKLRACQGYSAQNLSAIRRIAANLLQQESTAKCGVKAKRLKAGWDDEYLLKLLSAAAKGIPSS